MIKYNIMYIWFTIIYHDRLHYYIDIIMVFHNKLTVLNCYTHMVVCT